MVELPRLMNVRFTLLLTFNFVYAANVRFPPLMKAAAFDPDRTFAGRVFCCAAAFQKLPFGCDFMRAVH